MSSRPKWVDSWEAGMLEKIQDMIDTGINRLNIDIQKKLNASVTELHDNDTALSNKLDSMQIMLKDKDLSLKIIQKRQNDLTERVINMEMRSMRNNLLFSGIPEADGENEADIRYKLGDLIKYMHIQNPDIQITRCHRIGYKRPHQIRPRDIIAILNDEDKLQILRNARHLKGHDPAIFINEQFPPEINSRRAILRPIWKLAKSRKRVEGVAMGIEGN